MERTMIVPFGLHRVATLEVECVYPAFVSECAWCQRRQFVLLLREPCAVLVSHSICTACAARFEATYQERSVGDRRT